MEQEIIKEYSEDWRIVVSENGFLHMGRPKRIKCPLLGDILRIFDSYNIRRGGTSSGLGQLSQEGKQPNTQLDYNGVTDIPVNKILHIIPITKLAVKTYGFSA